MSEITVDSLHTYPVKSCAPYSPEELTVTDQGFEYDREWVVTRPNGVFLSQRNTPELALVRPSIANGELTLTAPSAGSVSVPLERDPAKEAVADPIEIFGKAGTAYTESATANDFFSDFLGKQVLLKRSAQPRLVNPKYLQDGSSNSSRHADGFPFLLTSIPSLELLSAHAGRSVPMSRFRPNIVVSGDNLSPYAEDYWRQVRIGDVQAFVVKACSRCPIPDVDQATGKRDPIRAVTQVLRESRAGTFKGSEKSEVFFGQNLLHVLEPGLKIAVGDAVRPTVLSWRQNFVADQVR